MTRSMAVVAALAIGTAAWNADEIAAATATWRAELVAKRSFVACDEPTEGEQLLIMVVRQDGRIAATCAYVGGSDSRRRSRGGRIHEASR